MLLLALSLLAPAHALKPEVPAAPPPPAVEVPAAPTLPAAARTWSAADFELAQQVLFATPLAALPRAGDPHFAALVSADPLRLGEGIPAAAMDNTSRSMQATGLILTRYVEGLIAGQPLHAEVLALSGSAMRWLVRQWDVLDAFLATQPPGFFDDPVRAQGMVQVKEGTATSLNGAVATIQEWRQWPVEPLAAFTAEAATALVRLTPRLDAEVQAELRAGVAKLMVDLPEGPVKAALAPAAGI